MAKKEKVVEKGYAILFEIYPESSRIPNVVILPYRKLGSYPNYRHVIGEGTEVPEPLIKSPYPLYARIRTKIETKDGEEKIRDEIFPISEIKISNPKGDLNITLDRVSVEHFLRTYALGTLRQISTDTDLAGKVFRAFIIGAIIIGFMLGVGVYAGISALKINPQITVKPIIPTNQTPRGTW